MKEEDIAISTDKNKLDVKLIHEFLTKSYWAEGRTFEQVKVSIENSLCWGMYLNDEQIGFARVLTDGTVVAYLMDVFITDKHRGKGYSKMLLNEVLAHKDLQSVGKWVLATKDAHDLYRQYGFDMIENPERLMSRTNKK
ncbi:MAG: GNAT family N-acetyltransferase [Ignavibacterium sp.]|nr:MAG: GNAT family N-acetyltransferase [Ignavibacterium sp.]